MMQSYIEECIHIRYHQACSDGDTKSTSVKNIVYDEQKCTGMIQLALNEVNYYLLKMQVQRKFEGDSFQFLFSSFIHSQFANTN